MGWWVGGSNDAHCAPLPPQVVSAWCEELGASVAVKVIKNQPAYYHQVGPWVWGGGGGVWGGGGEGWWGGG